MSSPSMPAALLRKGVGLVWEDTLLLVWGGGLSSLVTRVQRLASRPALFCSVLYFGARDATRSHIRARNPCYHLATHTTPVTAY